MVASERICYGTHLTLVGQGQHYNVRVILMTVSIIYSINTNFFSKDLNIAFIARPHNINMTTNEFGLATTIEQSYLSGLTSPTNLYGDYATDIVNNNNLFRNIAKTLYFQDFQTFFDGDYSSDQTTKATIPIDRASNDNDLSKEPEVPDDNPLHNNLLYVQTPWADFMTGTQPSISRTLFYFHKPWIENQEVILDF